MEQRGDKSPCRDAYERAEARGLQGTLSGSSQEGA